MHTPSDRVQLRRVGELKPPGNCALCGNGTCHEGYVDVDIFYEWEGQVYFCMNCALQIVQVIGCLTPEESEYLRNLNREIAEELKTLKEDHATALSRLAVFNDALSSIKPSAYVSDPVTGDVPVEDEQPQQESNDDATGGTSSGKPVAKKPVASRRSPNPAQPKLGDASKKFAI